jgi:hypothetical protein
MKTFLAFLALASLLSSEPSFALLQNGGDPVNADCPSGYALEGSRCVKRTSATLVCPSGSAPNGSGGCVSYVDKVFQCPGGYQASGSSCVRTVAAQYNCPEGYSPDNGGGGEDNGRGGINIQSSRGKRKGPGIRSVSPGSSCVKTLSASASCPSDYTRSGGNCIKTATPTLSCAQGTLEADHCILTAAPIYSCSGGGTIEGDHCIRNTVGTYSCPSGAQRQGTSCVAYVQPTYSCPNGGTLSGTSCVDSRAQTVRCPETFEMVNGACQKLVTAAVIRECPSGYSDIGNGQCRRVIAAESSCSDNGSMGLHRNTGLTKGRVGSKRVVPIDGDDTDSCRSVTAAALDCGTSENRSGRCVGTYARSESCPASSAANFQLNGSQCVAQVSASRSCPAGLHLVLGICQDSVPLNLSCSSGQLQGGYCISYADPVAGCSEGQQSGGSCILSTSGEYRCLAGVASNNRCEITSAAVPTCAVGSLSNGQCLEFEEPMCESGYFRRGGSCFPQSRAGGREIEAEGGNSRKSGPALQVGPSIRRIR